MLSVTRILFIILTLSVCSITYAQDKMRFFSAAVPVKSQSSSERAGAARQALGQVLVRMSGSENVLDDVFVLDKLKGAQKLVEQFQYQALDSESLELEGYRERISFTFAPSLVKSLLEQARYPYWAVNSRPTTLIWLVEDAEEGRQILNQSSESSVVSALDEAAQARGLPVIFPLLDLDDQLAISAEDVWQINEEAIMSASERYDADVILLGRYSRTSRGELWSIWQYYHAGESQSYDARFNLAEEQSLQSLLGSAALNPLADFLAQRYAISSQLESSGQLVMQLTGITDFAKYRLSMDYLESLAAVSLVHLGAVRQDTMLLFLESEASIEKLLSVLALDGKMQPASTMGTPALPVWQQAPQGSMENPLKFEWSI